PAAPRPGRGPPSRPAGQPAWGTGQGAPVGGGRGRFTGLHASDFGGEYAPPQTKPASQAGLFFCKLLVFWWLVIRSQAWISRQSSRFGLRSGKESRRRRRAGRRGVCSRRGGGALNVGKGEQNERLVTQSSTSMDGPPSVRPYLRRRGGNLCTRQRALGGRTSAVVQGSLRWFAVALRHHFRPFRCVYR